MEWLWGKPCLRLMNGLRTWAFHMSYFQLHLHYNLGMTILWQKESMIETTYTANCKSMMQVWPSSVISAQIYIYSSLDALLWGINTGIFLIFLCMLWNRQTQNDMCFLSLQNRYFASFWTMVKEQGPGLQDNLPLEPLSNHRSCVHQQ
jgi:hypothetical protein